jgi:hypothetical protein
MKHGFTITSLKASSKSTQCKHSLSPAAKIFKMQTSAGNMMLTVFWDSQGPILETYQKHGTTVTSATYCDMLHRELKPAICSKRGKLSKEILSCNNARPHTAAHTADNEAMAQRLLSHREKYFKHLG